VPPAPLIDAVIAGADLRRVLRGQPRGLPDRLDGARRRAEQHLWQWGGMPALLPLSPEERWKWLKDYEYTYLERDLGDLARLDDLEPFRTFQQLAALRSGRLVNYSELARDASVSAETAKRYLEYLRLSYQVVLLQPYRSNITSRVVKTPKLYWVDVGLLRQVSGLRETPSGELYETLVVSELYKWIKTAQRDAEVFFYRTRSGLEVDLLVQTPRGLIGMEIKSRRTLARKDVRALKDVAGGLGKRWRGGLVVYQGDELHPIAQPNIWALPSRRLFTAP
jgi:predicted AAA+ superfamily ATPase